MENTILEGLPDKWLKLLNEMPEIKNQMEVDKLNNKDEVISPYFFSYFYDDYEKCRDFFLCCEEGADVFNNFNEIYGKSNNALNKLNEEQIINLAKEYFTGINNLLLAADEEPYDIENMEIKICSENEFEEEYDYDEVENGDMERLCNQIVRHSMMKSENENFLANMEEPLYQLSGNYNLIYYILWPISHYKNFESPYKAYIELWKRNLKPILVDEDLLVILHQ